MDRKEIIKQLVKQGKTYQEIGDIFNISRQRVHQIITGYKSPYYYSETYKKGQRLKWLKNLEKYKGKNREKYIRYKLEVLTHYGGNPPKCARCGFSDINCLEIDHINNDGAEQRRKLSGNQRGSGLKFYRWLINHNFPKGYQVLCRNCNWLKYLESKGLKIEDIPS